MEEISIKIDDQDIIARKGATILETALANKIYIPHLCYHPDLRPAGSCRVCLVDLDEGKLVTSCRTPVKEGMVIKTKSTELDKVRRPIVEMIIADHHMDCKNCAKKGRCQLQRIMGYMKIDKKRIQQNLRFPKEELPIDDSNPFFIRDHNKCVLCGICVRTCNEIQRISAIDFAGRGNKTKIATFGDKPIAQSKCVSCGECVIRCPVGALIIRDFQRPTQEVNTVCPHCGVGCGVHIGLKDNKIVSVRGDVNSPVNRGNLCVKGRFGLGFVHSPDRLKNPLIKMSHRERKASGTPSLTLPPRGGGKGWGGDSELFKEVSWDEAFDFIAKKLKKYKGEEFAFIASPKCTNEDNYVAQKFTRVVMGSNNIDTSARLNDIPTITALLQAVGNNFFEEPVKHKGSINTLENASSILVVGADVTNSHPVVSIRIKKAVENGAKLIIISPKEIDLCRSAEIWLRPYSGTEVALLMGMCNIIAEEELSDNAFIGEWSDNFNDFKESLDDFTPGRVERITGVSRDKIEEAAKLFAVSKPAATLWSEEITQYTNGTDNVLAVLNLSLITGNIGNTPYNLFPLFSQNNTLGTFETGCVPDFYPWCQAVENPEVRKRFEKAWGAHLNPDPGLTFTEILESVYEGRTKALYIMGSNPVLSMLPSKKVKAALKKAKCVIFQDIFPNETSQYSHVILPAASFAEKEGTFTNIEGRNQGIHKAVEPVDDSRPDWQILCRLAKKLGVSGFDFNDSKEIMSEISSLSPGRPDRKTKFRFAPLQYRPPTEITDIDYPLLLITEKDIYSDGYLIKKVDGFIKLRKGDTISIHPKDASDFEITDGDMVRVISRWGEIKGMAQVTDSTPAGLVTIPPREEMISQLISPALDPVSKTPETKICAIKVVQQKKS